MAPMMTTFCYVCKMTTVFFITAHVKPKSRLKMFIGITVFPGSSEKKIEKEETWALGKDKCWTLSSCSVGVKEWTKVTIVQYRLPKAWVLLWQTFEMFFLSLLFFFFFFSPLAVPEMLPSTEDIGCLGSQWQNTVRDFGFRRPFF